MSMSLAAETPSRAITEPYRTRRTFAIISHPDAGKTTLTERLLAAAGAIQSAGAVRGKAGVRSTRSDWMEMEQQRGISITSSVMTFEYDGLTLNLLDTPGHSDFSEDTYRTLTAVDAAIMVICRQGHRKPDAEALRSLPPARHSHHHLHQQGGPRGPQPARPDR